MVAHTVNSYNPIGKQRQESFLSLKPNSKFYTLFQANHGYKLRYVPREKFLVIFFVMMVIVFKNELLKLLMKIMERKK